MRWLIVVSIILAIISYMADPVWGNLGEAQDNPQTIDEAIAAAILVHEADSEAHTGTGESLETHKTQSVLDHPPASVVIDKLTATEEYHDINFDTLDAWAKSTNVYLETFADCRIYVDFDAPNQYLKADLDIPDLWLNYDYDIVFQTIFRYTDDHFSDVYMGFFNSLSSPTAQPGFGFHIAGNVLKGRWYYGGSAHETSAISVNFNGEFHVYRAFYNSLDTSVHFYVDGEEVAVLSNGSAPSSSFADVGYYLAGDASHTNTLIVRRLQFSRGYANI